MVAFLLMDANEMTRDAMRRHIREDSDAELSRYLDKLNDAELSSLSKRDSIWAREAAMVVGNALINRKAARLLAARRIYT